MRISICGRTSECCQQLRLSHAGATDLELSLDLLQVSGLLPHRVALQSLHHWETGIKSQYQELALGILRWEMQMLTNVLSTRLSD